MTIGPEDGLAVLHGLASKVRLDILRFLHASGPSNVGAISAALGLPQSTVATNIQVLEGARLVDTRSLPGRKGNQKLCSFRFEEIVLHFRRDDPEARDRIEVAMPIGLYTECAVSAPCGLCSPLGVIGLLDVPDSFLQPERMNAALLWFARGYVEYKFPNNALASGMAVASISVGMELSSEVPGTNADWPSDITLTINGIDIGTWTSPGDYGDRRGRLTPRWWKLAGSQYGHRVVWSVDARGSFVDAERVGGVTVGDLRLGEHHSIRVRLGVAEDAAHPGGLNLFGRGFGDVDQDIVMVLGVGA